MENQHPESFLPPSPQDPSFHQVSSDDYDPITGLQIYRELNDAFYDTRINAPQSLNWRVRSHLMGPLVMGLTELGGGQLRVERSPGKIARASLEVIKIQWMLEGGDHRQVDGRDQTRTRLAAGDIGISDMTRRETTTQGDARSLCLIIPRHLFEANEADLDPLHGQIIRQGSVTNALLSAHMGELWRNAGLLTDQDVDTISAATTNLVGNLLIARQGGASGRGAERTEDILSLRLRRYIRDHLADPTLDAEHLCQRFALSRASLYRLFEPVGGVARHIREQRLKRAYREILARDTSSASIGRIARACGFTNATGFNRAFRRYFGVNPSEARTWAQARQSRDGSPERAYLTPTDWIRQVDAG